MESFECAALVHHPRKTWKIKNDNGKAPEVFLVLFSQKNRLASDKGQSALVEFEWACNFKDTAANGGFDHVALPR